MIGPIDTPSIGPRKKMPIAFPLTLVSHMSEIVPAPTDSPADPAALLSTLMATSIPMDVDLAARVLNRMDKRSEAMKVARRPCVVERVDHHNGQIATLTLVRATVRFAMEEEVCMEVGSVGSAAAHINTVLDIS